MGEATETGNTAQVDHEGEVLNTVLSQDSSFRVEAKHYAPTRRQDESYDVDLQVSKGCIQSPSRSKDCFEDHEYSTEGLKVARMDQIFVGGEP